MNKNLKIFIIGTTAVGKTKLSIELSKIMGGEVINSDSKQLYQYADVMTAKASQQQRQGIKHHLLDCNQLSQSSFNRNKYYRMASQCIQDVSSRNKVPIIVGGTNYYLETLLYDIDIKESQDEKQKEANQNKQSSKITKDKIQKMSKQQKYEQLKQIDPLMARKLHPNDQIRITSFLIRYAETNIKPSQNYKPYSHILRDPNTILFWLKNSDKQQLRQLMSKRILKMLKEGGLHQIIAIFQHAKANKIKDSGALQSIGYKQFQKFYEIAAQKLFTEQQNQIKNYPSIYKLTSNKIHNLQKYLQNIQQQKLNKDIDQNILKVLKQNVQQLQKSTVQYAKRQITWIKNRIFSKANQENQKHFFVLELSGMGTLLQRFDKQVKNRAIQIIKEIQNQGFGCIKENADNFSEAKNDGIKQWKKYYCEQCNVQVNGSNQWQEHLKSRKHRGWSKKKMRKNQKKQKKQMIKQAEQQDSFNEKQESIKQHQIQDQNIRNKDQNIK